MSYFDVIKSIPGLKHYYPLSDVTQARDVIGTAHGTNHGATFSSLGAKFSGKEYIEIPSVSDFSAVTSGALSVVAFQTVDNWDGVGAGSNGYIHWMGKGQSGAHEWTFRHYTDGGAGEAATRPKRTSFYCFNPAGGLGAGSYFQDNDAVGVERFIVGQYDKTTIEMWKNGVKRDSDPLSGYSITLKATSTPVRVGTRDMQTGFLIGRVRRLAFFNRKLTSAEILKLYTERAQSDGGSTPDPVPTPTNPLVVPANGTLADVIKAHNALVVKLNA